MPTTNVKRLYEIFPNTPHSAQPLGIRVNDTIYAGGLVGADPETGELAPDLESQMALALEHLKTLVERGGASLDNVGRCVAYVTTPDHREPTDAVWMKVFRSEQDKPAFKILIADLPPGQLVRLDGLALVGERRQRYDLPNVSAHDPTIRMGNWIFSSRLHGSSPVDGKVVPGGLDAEAGQMMNNMIQLVEAAGGAKDDIVQVNTFGRDESYIPGARRAFEAAFPDPAKRPAFHPLVSWVRETNAMMAEVTAVLDSAEARGEPFQELFLAPEKSNIADGVKLGALVYAPNIAGSDPRTRRPAGPSTGDQVRAALDNTDALMRAAGGGREHVARVNVYMQDVLEKDEHLNPSWSERFPDPDQRPPHSYIPARLPEGQRVGLQIIGLPGASRRSIYVDGMVHGDPMTLAAITGNLVFSSRISASAGHSREPVEHSQGMFANAESALTQVGGNLSNLQQAFISLHDPEHRTSVEAAWNERGVASKDVQFTYVTWDLGRGVLLPRLQMTAVV